MAKLVLKFKDMVRQEYPLLNPIVAVGRSPTNDIHIENLAVSRNHAQIVRNGDQYILEDLNSNNGTFVNGVRVQSHVLKDGDNILLGKHILQFFAKGGEELSPVFGPVTGGDSDDNETEMTIMTASRPRAAAPPAAVAAAAASQAGAPPPTPPSTGVLHVLQGSGLDRKSYTLTSPATVIGKGDAAEIRLSGFLTPIVAAVINLRGDSYYITPAKGWIKPSLNGAKLKEQTKLNDGDQIEVRSFRFQFSIR